MRYQTLDGWRFDIARAGMTCALYIAGFLLCMVPTIGLAAGFLGYAPVSLLLAFFAGPWLAAWITSKVLPSARRRLVLRLACGIYGGFLACYLLSGLISILLPKWPASGFWARHDAALVVIPVVIASFVGSLLLSRWRSRVAA